MHILTNMTPLMTFLVKFRSGDPPGKFFQIFGEKFFDHFTKMLTYDVILAPKMSHFDQFSPKMTYFGQIDPFNDFFSQIHPWRPPWNNFSKFLEKNFFDHFPQILTYDVILAPKMSHFHQFSPKMTYFG